MRCSLLSRWLPTVWQVCQVHICQLFPLSLSRQLDHLKEHVNECECVLWTRCPFHLLLHLPISGNQAMAFAFLCFFTCESCWWPSSTHSKGVGHLVELLLLLNGAKVSAHLSFSFSVLAASAITFVSALTHVLLFSARLPLFLKLALSKSF